MDICVKGGLLTPQVFDCAFVTQNVSKPYSVGLQCKACSVE